MQDIASGPVTRCQVCGSENLETVIDLGHQPLSDTLPTIEELSLPEPTYPLRQVWCSSCTLSQLDYVVPGEHVFHPEYPYRAGITRELAEYQDGMSGELIKALGLKSDDLVVDIGSNDGTLLSGFKTRGMRAVGVEPTNIAKIAQDAGIETLQCFFDEKSARMVRESHGPARLVTATNVFAHVAALGSFLRGLDILLGDDGLFVLENHYLVEIMRGGQFDTIYHEHLRSYSLTSLVRLFELHGYSVLDASQVSRYGGNIRVVVGKGKGRPASRQVGEILAMERDFGLFDPECYARFQARAQKAKMDLLTLAIECQRKGAPLIGNSCPARSATLLNYVGIKKDLMPWIAEQPTSLKLGRHLCGTHIPIVDNERLIKEQPECVVLLAWHYARPIAEQLRARGLRSKFIVPLPEMTVLDV
ncbi:class I SAM-dependent methyltransferase [Roseobacter sp.]|uniref:class I SAM-dependent methyltransferase n=1 Tax=Roseobacter sp. TaxID=1907202 RepID=UPI00329A1A25